VVSGENRAPTPVMVGDGGMMRRYLGKGITATATVYLLVLF
jgi:hypothetical protein